MYIHFHQSSCNGRPTQVIVFIDTHTHTHTQTELQNPVFLTQKHIKRQSFDKSRFRILTD
jgi:hypothetical protein